MVPRLGLAAPAGALLALLLAACGGGGSSGSEGTQTTGAAGGSSGEPRTVHVQLTDAGCDPSKLTLPAGPATFAVTNDGAGGVTELEILDGDRILGEVENIAPGLSGSFSLTLKPGTLTLYCPGGSSAERGTLTVTQSGGAAASTGSSSATVKGSVAKYLAYVQAQTQQLVPATTQFAQAIEAGDLERAKSLFAPARFSYEAVEPIAESFGTLDPLIDARAGDVPEAQWGGFHRIEKALWQDGTTAGMTPVARKLVDNVKQLAVKVPGLQLEPAQIANGAVELLNEVASSKITGEEDRYSHTDLSDFRANVDGAKAAFDALRPLVAATNPALATEITARFAAVDQALSKYERNGGYVSYLDLTKADTRALAQAVDALAEPLSRVAGIVVQQQ
jgi:iron uptake system component EfeO